MLIYILGLIGVAVFAVSGSLAAGRKGLDWVGVIALAMATGLGGGTIRDVLLNRDEVFWIADPNYVWVIFGAAAVTIIYTKFFKPPHKSLLIADAWGLALFAIVGAQIAEMHQMSPLIVVLMGIITGAAGGVIRDIFSGQTPILFKSDEPLYSVAALAGLLAYLGLQACGLAVNTAAIVGVLIIASTRMAAMYWNIVLPAFLVKDEKH